MIRQWWYDDSNMNIYMVFLSLYSKYNMLRKSGKYFPNEISIVHVAAEQSKDKIKICDQLEKLTKRLKVNKVWHQSVLKAISISWVCTLSSPLGSLDSNSNMTRTHTHMQTYILIPEHIQSGMWSVLVLHTHVCTQLYQHTVIPNAMRPALTQTFNLIRQLIKFIK